MRVVIAHKFYRPVGGTEEFVRQLSSLLEAHSHEVIPFAMAHPDNWPSPYSSYFVPEIDYRADLPAFARLRRALAGAPRLFYSADARRRFDRLIAATRPDVIHIQGIYHQISPSILYAATARRIPVVQTVNDYKLVCPAVGLMNGRTKGPCTKCLPGRYWHALVDHCQDDSYGRSAAVVAEMYFHHAFLKVYERHVDRFLVENRTRLELLERGGIPSSKIRLLAQPFDASSFQALPMAGEPRFLYFGRLDADKGVDLLIQAAALANVAIDVVGTGTEDDRLKRLAATMSPNPATFHGPVYGSDLRPLVASSWATVLPSRQMEGTPYAVLASFAYARGVVATAVGALPEIIDDGLTGLIVPPGDVGSLASALRRVANDLQLARAIGSAARSSVLAGNNPDRYYDALIQTYDQVRAG